MFLRYRIRSLPFGRTTGIRGPSRRRRPPKWTTFHRTRRINTAQLFSELQPHLIFIPLSLSVIPSMSSMKTRAKNRSAHPGIPDMTPSQLASAGLPNPRRASKKKLTKDQQIAALKDELRVAQELAVSSVTSFVLFYSYFVALTPVLFLEPF